MTTDPAIPRAVEPSVADAFQIRIAGQQDAARLSLLLEACFPALMAASYDRATLNLVLPLMTRPNPGLLASGTYYVAALETEQIVGCGGWTPERPGRGDVAPGLAHIRHFGTHPDWIGRGVGRAILATCEAQARRCGIRRLECFASLNAVGFYAASGFRSLRRVEVAMRPEIMLSCEWMAKAI